jgi:hypothetical protein
MNAADDISRKVYSTTGETTLFSDAYSPLTVTLAQFAAIDALLTTGLMADIAGGILLADTTTCASVVAATALITGTAATSAAAVTSATNLIKSYGFALFTKPTHPSYVNDVVTSLVATPLT